MELFQKNKDKSNETEGPKIDIISAKQKILKLVAMNDLAINKFENKITSLRLQGRQLLAKKDKRRAKLAVSRIYSSEKQINKLSKVNSMLYRKIDQIEGHSVNTDILNAVNEANKAVQHVTESASIDSFENIKEVDEEIQNRNDQVKDLVDDAENEQYIDNDKILAALQVETPQSGTSSNVEDESPLEEYLSKTNQETINKEEADILAQLQ